MVKGLIFDYGGTIDSRGRHWSWVIRDGYEAAGVMLPLPVFRDAYVWAERELARTRHILPHHNFLDLLNIKMKLELQWLVDNCHLEKSALEKSAVIARYCYNQAMECVNEAKPVLDRLKERLPMVLVSNFYGNVEAVLEDFGLRHYFQAIIESAVVGVRKPDPRIFELGVEALDMKPEEVMVVGDSYRKDIEPALKIGCQVMWLKGAGWTADEDAVMHKSIIKNLKEVAEAVLT